MSTSLIFSKLVVRQMTGLSGAFELPDLSPGINVIFGPNGVGKSRTARAINLALWPRVADANHAEVAAWMTVGDEPWCVEVDGSDFRYQRRGTKAELVDLPTVETSDRYNLVLQDLLGDKGEGFADAILRESAGGYDLNAARVALDLGHKPQPRTSKETDALKQAVKDVRDAELHIDALRQREQGLEELSHRRDEALAAARQVPRLELAIQYVQASHDVDAARDRLAGFPPNIEILVGTELRDLDRLDSDLNDLNGEIARARLQESAADARVNATALKDAEIDPTLIGTLTQRCRLLSELQQQIPVKQEAIKAASAQRDRARMNLGPNVSDEKLTKLDIAGLQQAAQFSREAEQIRAELIAARSLSQWVGPLGSSPSSDIPEKALSLLHQWLRRPEGKATPSAHSWPMQVAAALLTVLSLTLAYSVHWGLIVIAPIGPALYFVWRRSSSANGSADAARPYIQGEYAKLGVPMPSAWSQQDVETLCQQVGWTIAEAKVEEARAVRWADLPARAAQAQEQYDGLDLRRQQMVGKLGVAPKVNEAVFYLLVENINRWQEADRELAAEGARYESLKGKYAGQLALITAAVAAYGYAPNDSLQAAAAIEDLRRRIDELRMGCQEAVSARKSIQSLEERGRKLAVQRTALFSGAGLGADDVTGLRELVGLRPAYDESKAALQSATDRARDRAAQLDDAKMLNLPLAELENELFLARQLEAEAQPLSEQVAEIRAEIDVAQRASSLETAIANRAEATASLKTLRDTDCAVAAGWALAECLRQVTRERRRPEVFRRAREVFARITHGRYQLEFDESDPPAFRAIDTTTGFGQAMDELSAGTRVQLLLAVRVAFVDQQERGSKLPLILDEALANSDDSRARQIVEALIGICRSGRQIFYFTAQVDEVSKWRDILAAAVVPHRLIDLAEIRGLAQSERTPLRQIVAIPPTDVPSMDGMDKIACGRMLKVPGIDPMRDNVGGIHLWHLLDDMTLLRSQLILGIKTWGQWKNLAEFGGPSVPRDGYERAEARVRVLEQMVRLWRIGCGRRVEKQTVVNCPVITDRFQGPVISLTEEVNGDARQLISRIEAKAVARFRSESAAEFRQYLAGNGFLDERIPLTTDELRTRVLISAVEDIKGGMVTSQHVDEYLGTWFRDVTVRVQDTANESGLPILFKSADEAELADKS